MNRYSRFRGDCWIVETSEENSACIMSETDDTFHMFGVIRGENPIKVSWETKDPINHSYCSYPTNYDYTNVKLEFDIVKHTTPLKICITDLNDRTKEISLNNNKCNIFFNDLTLIDITKIVSIDIITVIDRTYNNIELRVKNINTNYILGDENPQIISHNFSLTETYDNCKQFTPRRLIYEMKKIGYINNFNLSLGNGAFAELIGTQEGYLIDSNLTAPTLYVDGIYGNDENDGKTKSTALKTIPELNKEYNICLLEGSYDIPIVTKKQTIFGCVGENINHIKVNFPITLDVGASLTLKNITGYSDNEKLFITENEIFENNNDSDIDIKLKDCHSVVKVSNLVIDSNEGLNFPCKKWIEEYIKYCEYNKINAFNISFDHLNKYIPIEWRQQYSDGQYYYEDGAYAYSFNNVEGVKYIQMIIEECLSLFENANYIPSVQLNKVQWYHNDTDIAIYDKYTEDKDYISLSESLGKYLISLHDMVVGNKGILGVSIAFPEQGDQGNLMEYNYPYNVFKYMDYIEMQDFPWVLANSSYHNSVYEYPQTLGCEYSKIRYLGGIASETDYNTWNNIIDALYQAENQGINLISIYSGNEIRRDSLLLPSNTNKNDVDFEDITNDNGYLLQATIDNQTLGYDLKKIIKKDVHINTVTSLNIPYDTPFTISGSVSVSNKDNTTALLPDGQLKILLQDGNITRNIGTTSIVNGEFSEDIKLSLSIQKYTMILVYEGNKFYNNTSIQIDLNINKRYVIVEYDQILYNGYPNEKVKPNLVFKDECGYRLPHFQFTYTFNNQTYIDMTDSAGQYNMELTVPNQIENNCPQTNPQYSQTLLFRNGQSTTPIKNIIKESIILQIKSVTLQQDIDYTYDEEIGIIKLTPSQDGIGIITYKTKDIIYEPRSNHLHLSMPTHPNYQMDYSVNDKTIYAKKIDTSISINKQYSINDKLFLQGSVIAKDVQDYLNVKYGTLKTQILRKQMELITVLDNGNFEIEIPYNVIFGASSNNITEYKPIEYNTNKVDVQIQLEISPSEAYQGDEDEFIAKCSIHSIDALSSQITDGVITFVVNDGVSDIDQYIGELTKSGDVYGYIYMTKPGKYYVRAVYNGMFEYGDAVSDEKVLIIKER